MKPGNSLTWPIELKKNEYSQKVSKIANKFRKEPQNATSQTKIQSGASTDISVKNIILPA